MVPRGGREVKGGGRGSVVMPTGKSDFRHLKGLCNVKNRYIPDNRISKYGYELGNLQLMHI